MSILEKATLEMIKNILNGVTVPEKAKIAEIAKLLGEDTVGSETKPIYLAEGEPKECTLEDYNLYVGAKDEASNAETENGSTYVKLYKSSAAQGSFKISGSGATKVTSDEDGNIVITSTDTVTTDLNYYPTSWSWTNGTTSGPTATLSGTGMSAVSVGAVPAASGSQSGVVTTGSQTFAGAKTFSSAAVLASGSTLSASPSTSDDSLKIATTAWVRDTTPYVASYASGTYYVLASYGSATPSWKTAYSILQVGYSYLSTSWTSVYPESSRTSRNGYVRFRISSSYYLQIAYGTFVNTTSVTFAKYFGVAPFVLTTPGSYTNNHTAYVKVESVSTTGFTTYDADSGSQGYYIAIGYST